MGRKKVYSEERDMIGLYIPKRISKRIEIEAKNKGVSKTRLLLEILEKHFGDGSGEISEETKRTIKEAVNKYKHGMLIELLKLHGAGFEDRLKRWVALIAGDIKRNAMADGITLNGNLEDAVKQEIARCMKEHRDIEDFMEHIEFLSQIWQKYHAEDIMRLYAQTEYKRIDKRKLERFKRVAEKFFGFEFPPLDEGEHA